LAINWTLEITNFYIMKSSVTNNILCLSNCKVYYGKETQYKKTLLYKYSEYILPVTWPFVISDVVPQPRTQICESDTFSPSIVTLGPTF